MADSVVDPAPSPSAPVVDPAAALAAKPDPVAPVVADPAKPAVDPANKPAVSAPVIPEKYDFSTIKMPAGVEINADIVEAISPILKEIGLTQENAGKLVEAHANALAKAESVAEAKRESDFTEFMKTTVTNYQATIRKEWGADHDANVVIAQKGMARVFSAEAKKLLDDTGLGNHPEFLKAFLQVGKMVSEDKPPNGATPAGKKSNAEVFYGVTN